MLIYLALCVISIVTPWSMQSPIIASPFPTLNIEPKAAADKLNGKRNILDVLNPVYVINSAEESNNSEPEELELPKLTIWEFPTERRVFIGDKEVFVQSTQSSEYSNENVDPLNLSIRHPHKHHELHANILNEEQFPPFRMSKHKHINDEVEDVTDNIITTDKFKRDVNNDLVYIVKYVPKLSRNKRDVNEKEMTDSKKDFIYNDISPGQAKVRRRRLWGIDQILEWIMSDVNTFNDNVEENQNKQPDNNDETILESNEEVFMDDSAVNENNISNNKEVLDSASKISIEKILLQPLDPEQLEAVLKEYGESRKRRSINSETDINLVPDDRDKYYITNDNSTSNDIDTEIEIKTLDDIKEDMNNYDEDDNNELLMDNLIKFLRSGVDFYAVLITIY